MKTMNRQKGLSLVELMVAMVLGLVLMGGVIQVMTSSQDSYNELVQQSRMQETAKIAMDYIVRDLRNVGYWGCSSASMRVANTVWAGGDVFNMNASLLAWREGDVNLPAVYEDIALGSDVVQMRVIDIVGGLSVASHNPSSATIQLNSAHFMPVGTIWAVVDRDCSNIGIFAQSGPTNNPPNNAAQLASWTGANQVVHNTGSGKGGALPNNCTKNLKGDFDCNNHTGLSKDQAYSPGSSVFTVSEVAYSVEPSTLDANVNALYRREGGNAQELIDGIANLTYMFGVDADGDGTVDRFASANDINAAGSGMTFGNVISLAINLEVSAEPGSQLGNQTFTTSVRLRNRGLQ